MNPEILAALFGVPRVLARQRSEVARLWWSDYTGWHYVPQSDRPPRRGWSPGRWTQEEIVALAFDCGFGAVRLPDGKMIKRAKECGDAE